MFRSAATTAMVTRQNRSGNFATRHASHVAKELPDEHDPRDSAKRVEHYRMERRELWFDAGGAAADRSARDVAGRCTKGRNHAAEVHRRRHRAVDAGG